ncbi:MAG TPA: hypothetical protein VFQ53_23820 [Kofleriaceae bacterium]|nr:hypothetical protein [Kofleriaceae bacterium]
MRHVLLLAIAFMALGCRNKAIDQLEDIKREVCACKDVACGEAAMKKVPQPQERVEQSPKSQQLAREMIDCMAKLYLAERPSTDPDEAAPTSPGSADPASARTP